MPDNYNTTH